jgi:ribosome-binding factor A
MADPRRIQRIQSRLRQDIAELFLKELRDPRVKALISITRVEVSKDLTSARVYWSMLGSLAQRRAAERFIEGATGFIQSRVAQDLELRSAPRLTFHYDESIEKGAAVSKLIDEAMQADSHGDE